MPRCTLTPAGDGLALASPYDPAFVAAFKASVPAQARRWDAGSKRWLISHTEAHAVADLCEVFFMERPHVPAIQAAQVTSQIRVFKLEYLGACKPRDGAEVTATGYCDGAWSVIAPESVLRAWFDGASDSAAPGAAATYYSALGIQPDATSEQIKAGYKRMARQWHPDLCKEPDAHERFLAVRDAYNILSDAQLRRKYDAGRLFEQRAGQERSPRDYRTFQVDYYRSPLRCGMLLADAAPSLGRWRLVKILAWDDILDGAGRVMVASWDTERERIRVEWTI